MRLPVIKGLVDFIETHDEDYLNESAEVLEHLSQVKGIKQDELIVIGELLSNIFGALEVTQEIRRGKEKNKALNAFMQRVVGTVS